MRMVGRVKTCSSCSIVACPTVDLVSEMKVIVLTGIDRLRLRVGASSDTPFSRAFLKHFQINLKTL